jgi:predicted DCC family thiol-disulfide oxidoreductase YuxK
MARWVRRRARAGRVLAIANQKPGMLARYGLSREEVDRSAWTVDRDGHRLEGAAAINRVLTEMGGPLPFLSGVYRLKLLAEFEEVGYRWFARNRSRFSPFGVRPECEEPGADCE